MKKLIWFLLFIYYISINAQEADISSALRQIELGQLSEAELFLKQLKQSNPNEPAVIFLDAVLTKNGDEAIVKYSSIVEKHPKSKYADAALYRIYSYYYARGLYKKAGEYYNRLKIDFPQSPYAIIATRNIPEKEEVKPRNDSERQPDTISKSDSTKYIIQAGAFLSLDNAAKLKEQLRRDGYNSEISSKDIGGTILNVVTIGEFDSEDESSQVLSHLETNYKLRGRIIRK